MTKLYIVPTPIGNLGDITYRAVSILDGVETILAEDTRKTMLLLKKYNLSGKLQSFHKFNEHQLADKIISRLVRGESIALVTDAGTPGISDPGYLLVKKCLENQVELECLPGPTALIPALVVSGLPSDRFVFEGFLPVKKGRTKRLKELAAEKRTIILYESPHRIQKTLHDLSEHLGPERNGAIVRELTKIHEEVIRGKISQLVEASEKNQLKGEIVLVIQGIS